MGQVPRPRPRPTTSEITLVELTDRVHARFHGMAPINAAGEIRLIEIVRKTIDELAELGILTIEIDTES